MDKPKIIAEVGQAHDGSLGLAHSYIDAIADAGADVVKFQMHIASEESTINEKFRIPFSQQDRTRFEYWDRMGFSFEQWKGLVDHAKSRCLLFSCSAFSIEAVRWLSELNVDIWKVGSGDVEFREMIMKMLITKKPIFLSTGMSGYEEIERCVKFFEENEAQFTLFQCTSMYPTPLHLVGLNALKEFRDRFKCPIGLSDHSGTVFPALKALSSDVNAIELHVVFDKRMFGPDTAASLDFGELKLVCDARDAFQNLEANPVNKDFVAKDLFATKELFRRSLCLSRSMKKGDVVLAEDIVEKKPGNGIDPSRKREFIGKKLIKDVTFDSLLTLEDFE